MSRGDWQKEKIVLDNVNAYRKSLNLSELKWNKNVAHFAEEHSLNMAEKKVPFSHNGINERLAEIKKLVPGYVNGSENVAYSKPDMDPVGAWKKSAGHNKNLIGNWTDGGIGYVERAGFHYYTAIFIRVK